MRPPREARGHCIWPESSWPDTREFSFWSFVTWCRLRAVVCVLMWLSLQLTMSISALLHTVVEGRSLTETEAQEAMRALLAGESTPVLTAAFLTALRMKGETVDELTGFARAMRAAALVVPIEDACRPVVDTCGTGGNGA